jgi:hypothetical protein
MAAGAENRRLSRVEQVADRRLHPRSAHEADRDMPAGNGAFKLIEHTDHRDRIDSSSLLEAGTSNDSAKEENNG